MRIPHPPEERHIENIAGPISKLLQVPNTRGPGLELEQRHLIAGNLFPGNIAQRHQMISGITPPSTHVEIPAATELGGSFAE
jgi:hypothetical protein